MKEIDIVSSIRIIRKDKKKLALFCLAGIILGVAVALDNPKIYKSSVMLAPESSNANSLTSNISSLASMVGMDMSFGGGSDAIYPELYPDLISSMDFLVSLFPVKVTTIKGDLTTDYFDYLKNHNKKGWWTFPAKWLAAIVQKLKSDDFPSSGDPNKIDPFRLSKDQFAIAQAINRSIECSVDKKTSVINIVVSDQDPLIAATMADTVKTRLQNFITDYRTKKARNDLAYMEKLFAEAKEQYVKARQQYAAFSDANQDLILESVRSKQEDLENEMQLRYTAYTQISEQLQLSRAKVQERTPVFTVVQSASVPIKHSNTSKATIVLMFLFLAASIRIAYLILRHYTEIFHHG